MSEMLRAAIAYARRGWRIFPTHGKTPLVSGGVHAATDDLTLITTWWGYTFTNANIALNPAASGVLVVDADAKKDGPRNWAAWRAAYGLADDTMRQRSGGGGEHWFYRLPYGAQLRGGTDKLASGVDVLVGGLPVTLTPSLHRSGQRYTWLSDADTLADAPAAVLAACAVPPAATVAEQRANPDGNGYRRCINYLRRMEPAMSGSNGHGRTFAAACVIWRFGLSPDEAAAAMRWFNAFKCQPRWSDADLRHKLDSAHKEVASQQQLGALL